MTSCIIEDGYTEAGYIKESKGLYPELRFAYRPMLHAERDAIASQIGTKTPEQVSAIFVAAARHRIISWTAKHNGQPVEINDENIRRLRPSLFDRLYNVIAGAQASDPDPKATPDARQGEADAALEAAITGQMIGAVKEAAAEKNSEAD